MEEVTLRNVEGEVLASSRDVAEKFKKSHKDVMVKIEGKDRANRSRENGLIDGILKRGNPLSKYFIKSQYESRGKTYDEYLMTRDGFSLLVMGFTGEEALDWKLKYINAFNKMEETLKNEDKALPTTYKEALIQLLEQVEINDKLEDENKVLLPKANYHDSVLNKDGLITTTVIAKDMGLTSAAKLNQVMFLNKIIYKKKDGSWCPYAKYEWLITDGYADYKSYENKHSKPCLKWTEKGREWVIHSFDEWNKNV